MTRFQWCLTFKGPWNHLFRLMAWPHNRLMAAKFKALFGDDSFNT